MKNGHQPGRRRLSAGTVVMLVLLAAVLGGSVLVLGRLSSGASVDLSKLNMSLLDLQEDGQRNLQDTEEAPAEITAEAIPQAARKQETQAAETTDRKNKEGFTLTVGGSISLSGEVRKNSQSTDTKTADYADVMMLLAPQINSDVNAVFLENILSDRQKANDNIAPEKAVTLLKEAGFDTAACGFSQAYSSGRDGVEATLMTLDRQGISALGIRYADDPGEPQIRTVNGVKAAFLQYSATVPVKTRNSMVKDGTDGMIPEADIGLITKDIDLARQKGAEAVIILLNWGKVGKDQDKKQRELAEGIAAAGADLII
ncbi:MAG: CapA family protein, partial [Clostridia bacterium]|nr:CapA family protein [Clostridia bacterium]